MGISTLRSYRGAQIFEAIGLDRDFVDRYFTGTQSRVSGVGEDVIARETLLRHERAFARDAFVYPELDPGGLYQWRQRGERHTFNPDTVAKLQHAVRSESYATFKEYSQAANDDAERLCTLRGILKFKPAPEPVPLDEVEPAAEHHAPLLHRRDVLRLDLARRAPDARGGDEPDRRQEQHRRGRRGSAALHAAAERRLAAQRDQAGGVGALRRDQLVSRQRGRAADQDRAGREAGRRRAAARPQGRRDDREDPLLDAGRRADLAAAAPRHLLDRGPGPADPRPEEREPAGATSA